MRLASIQTWDITPKPAEAHDLRRTRVYRLEPSERFFKRDIEVRRVAAPNLMGRIPRGH